MLMMQAFWKLYASDHRHEYSRNFNVIIYCDVIEGTSKTSIWKLCVAKSTLVWKILRKVWPKMQSLNNFGIILKTV